MSALRGKADLDLTLCNMSVLAMRGGSCQLSHDRLDLGALLQRNNEIAKFVRQFRERGRCGAKSNCSRRIGKTLTFTLVQGSSWESRAEAITDFERPV